jgi:hypothetical protein
MTSVVANIEERLARIHETGYWRVLLHPTEYDPLRISTLKACLELIEATRVRLQGWAYPHSDPAPNDYICGENWIQSGSDFGNHVELWRLFQSGQFVHHLSVTDDRMPLGSTSAGERRPGPLVLDFVNVLYTVTEILQFVQGLAYRGVLDPAASLTIELHGMKARQLVAPPDRLLTQRYVCHVETIRWPARQISPALVARAPELAVDAAMAIFERFGWLDVSRDMLVENQRRLLERRL